MGSVDRIFFSKSEIQKSYRLFCEKQTTRPYVPRRQEESGPSLSEFIRDHKKYIRILLDGVKSGEFELTPTPPSVLVIDRARTHYRFPWPERFLAAHFARAIFLTAQPTFSPRLYSFQHGKSSVETVVHAHKYLFDRETSSKSPIYVLRRDVKNYGESLIHDWVMKDFVSICEPSEALRSLLQKFCRFPILENDKTKINQVGMPMGSYLQIVFENIYLSELDHALSAIPGGWFARYGDDILFLTTEAEAKDEAIGKMNAIVQARGLRFSVEKSSDFILNRDPAAKERTQLFRYLGMALGSRAGVQIETKKLREVRKALADRLRATARLIPKRQSAQRRVDILISQINELIVQRMDQTVDVALDHIREMPAELEVEQLREMDRWLALLVLSLATEKSFRPALFRRMSYRELRSRGLPSLLYLKRTRGLGHARVL